MDSLWPWLTIAGLGALHGLSPANGWMFAAACGVREGDGAQTWRALLPIAIGHLVSILIVAGVALVGVRMDGGFVQQVAGASLIGVATFRMLCRTSVEAPAARIAAKGRSARHAGLALWSCLMSTAHGAGWMLLPALAPLCLNGAMESRAAVSQSIALASAALVLHLAAMLLATGAIATGVRRGLALLPHLSSSGVARRGWTVMLLVVGLSLLAPG